MHLLDSNNAVADGRLDTESLPIEDVRIEEAVAPGPPEAGLTSPPELSDAPTSWLGRLAGQGALSLFDQGIVSGTNFVTNVLLFRVLGETAFGWYVSLQNGLLLLRGFQDQLICAPHLLYAQRHRGEDLARYTGSMFLHQAVAMIVVAIIWGIVCVSASFALLESNFTLPAAILMVAGPAILSRDFARQISYGRLEIGGAVVLDSSIALVQFLGLGCLLLFGAVSLPAVFLVLGVSALTGLAVWFFLKPLIECSAEDAAEHFVSNWTFSRWTLASHLLGSTMPLVMPWILAGMKGFSATGFLAACNTIVGVANMFVVGMCNYLCPRAAKAFADEGVSGLTRLLGLATALFGGVLGAFTLAAWLGGDWLASMIFGREIPGGGLLLTLLAAGVLANGIGMTAGNGLWAIERPQGNFAADGVQCLVTILATVLLVPTWGEAGSAMALLLGTASGTIVRWVTLLWLLRGEEFAPRTA